MTRASRLSTSALLAIGLAAAGVACHRPSPRGLVVAYPVGLENVIPNQVNEEITVSILCNVYETLVDFSPGLEVRPGMAESWHSTDDLTWVFRLRGNLRAHNERLVDASHVAASLENARTDPSSRRRLQLSVVESFEVPNPRTLIVHTRVPFDSLPARLGNIFIGVPPFKTGVPPPGTGPYRVRSWSPGGTTVLQAFDDYHGGKPSIPWVEFRVVPSIEERVRTLLGGDVDLLTDVPAERLTEVSAQPGIRTVVQHGLRVLLVNMDCVRSDSPFRDLRVRQAVALALDREKLVSGPLGGQGEIVETIVSPQEIGGQEPGVTPRPHDPAKARALLAAAGFRDGFSVTLDHMRKYRAIDNVARQIARDLERIGVHVTPVPHDVQEMLSRIQRRDTRFYLGGWISEIGDGRMSYEYLIHSRQPELGYGVDNSSGYSNPQVDEMIEQATRPMRSAERTALLTRLALKVHEDLPVIPLYRQADLFAFNQRLVFVPRLDLRIRAAELSWR